MARPVKHQYLVISGFGSERGPKGVTLMEGNLWGERSLRMVKSLPAGTTYSEARAEADRLAGELGIRLGRNFTAEEWAGRA